VLLLNDHSLYIARMSISPKILFFTIGSLFFAGSTSYAFWGDAEFRFQSLNADKGLSQNTITDIIQDKDGFIWIACENGLNRFDGSDVLSFSTVRTNSGKELNTMLLGMKLFDDGLLWLDYHDRNPYVCYHKSIGFKTWYEHFLNLESCDSLHLVNLLLCSDKHYWGMVRNVHSKKYAIGYFENHNFIPVNQFSTTTPGRIPFFEDNAGNLWFAPHHLNSMGKLNLKCHQYTEIKLNYQLFVKPVRTGFYSLTGNTIQFTSFKTLQTNTVYKAEENTTITSLFAFEDYLLFSENDTTIVYFSKGKTARITPDRKHLTDNRLIEEIALDRHQNAWMAVPGYGAIIWLTDSRQFHCIPADKNDPTSLTHHSIARAFADRDGNIILGSMYGGAFVFNNYHHLFRYNSRLNKELAHHSVASVVVDSTRNCLWVSMGTSGIAQVQEGVIKQILLGNFQKSIGQLLLDNPTDLWLATREEGLLRYNLNNGKLQSLESITGFSSAATSRKIIRQLVKDSEDNLWICTWDGLLKLHPNRHTYQHIRFDYPPGDLRNGWNVTFTIVESSRNTYLVGTEYGIVEIDKEGTVVQSFTPDKSNPSSLNHPTVFCLLEDDNRILAGTYGGGLNLIDRITDHCQHLTTDNGLPNNQVAALQKDEQGNFWIATGNGLARLNAATGFLTNYSTADGLPFDRFNQKALLKTNDGRLIAYGSNGIFSFKPDDIASYKTQKLKLVITDMDVLDSPKDFKYFLQNNEKLVLSPTEKIVRFEFVAPGYDTLGNTEYEYKIENLHEHWIDNGTNRQLIFTNLPPGKHQLMIRVKSIHQQENPIKTVPITIQPPFYQTTLFKLMSVVVLLLITTLIFTSRIRRMKRLEAMRIQIASDLHDEIGGSLSTIGFIGYKLAGGEISPTQLQKTGDDLVKASRISSEAIRDIIWFITPGNDPFPAFIAHQKTVANQLLQQQQLNFESTIDAMPPETNGKVKRNIYMIYKEVITNIVKHSNATQVDIAISLTNKKYKMRLADNGIGFNTQASVHGYGLNNITTRSTAIGAVLNIETQSGQGTVVTLEVKL
jgi:hypothetical protein